MVIDRVDIEDAKTEEMRGLIEMLIVTASSMTAHPNWEQKSVRTNSAHKRS